MSTIDNSPQQPIPFLTGKTVNLQPFTASDFTPFIRWVNDPEVRQYARNMFPFSRSDEKKFLAEYADISQKSDWISFAITISAENRTIGIISLHTISWPDRHGWLGLMIGDKDCWGKGYAVDAGNLLLDYAFGELDMHKVMVGIFSPNKRSQGAALKLGFKFIGTQKDEIFVDGKYVDGFYYELFKDDWRNQKSEKTR